MSKKVKRVVAAVALGWVSVAQSAGQSGIGTGNGAAPHAEILALDKCVAIALEKNRRRPASQFAVAMAEAQHRQVLSTYWPQVKATAGVQRMDQPLNFLFPASNLPIPAQTIQTPPGTVAVTVPANAFGPGFPPADIQMPVTVPGQTIRTEGQNFAIPAQDIQVLNRNVTVASTDMKWLLFDGGMRKGLREQTAGNIEMMRQEARRTDLEVVDGVTRMYWGAILARQLHHLGRDTLARMTVTLRLTESLYKEGSGTVTKADFLDNQVMVESLRAMVASLEKNERMAEAALANTMGLSWTASVRPADESIPFQPQGRGLEELVGESYRFNPDWGKLEAALKAAEGAVQTARSEYFPKIALTGELHRWWNGGAQVGASTRQNRAGWSVGMGVEIPIFNGFLTKAKIEEVRAQVNRLKQSQFLLKEGLGLQVKDLVLGIDAVEKADQASANAMKSATENRELNSRAYDSGLVETEKVIRAQLVESLMSAQHYMTRYQHAELRSRLNVVVGAAIQEGSRRP